MPFMKGAAPIRRTWEYLQKGKIVFKESVKIMSINYNTKGENSDGARRFVFWNLPQLQYKNPGVQIVTLKDMTPTPFVQFYLDSGEQVLVDVDFKSQEDIRDHLKTILGKSKETLEAEAAATAEKLNPGNFGRDNLKQCICEIPGQVPCPAFVRLPDEMRGKYKNQPADDF